MSQFTTGRPAAFPYSFAPCALTPAFAQIATKPAQWKAFLRRSSPQGMPANLGEVVDGIAAFLLPILAQLAASQPVPGTWTAAGPWED